MAVQFKQPGTILFGPADPFSGIAAVAMDPDCCCNTVECPDCGGEGNNAPATLYVDPSDIVDSECTSCEDYNSQTLTIDESTGVLGACTWMSTFSCDGHEFAVVIMMFLDTGHTFLTLNVSRIDQPTIVGSWWKLDMGTDPVDCLNLDVELGPAEYQYDYQPPDACVWSGASWWVRV